MNFQEILDIFDTNLFKLLISLLKWWLQNKSIKYQYYTCYGSSLVAQWLRIHLPMQGTWVRALVREDPTCRGATKPLRHNY